MSLLVYTNEDMSKIRINMLSQATSVPGQGVGSAYMELIALLKECEDIFEVQTNSKSSKFDIYHMHTVNIPYRLRFNKKHVNVMYVHFLPSTMDGSLKMPRFNLWCFKKYLISLFKKADELVVVNPAYIKPLIELGVKKENITYIPNFVDHEIFSPLSKEEVIEIKEKYNVPIDKFVVLGCGQIQTRKGFLDFIETAKRNPDKVFVWAGGFSFGKSTAGYKQYKAIVDNPPENVKFPGIVPRDQMNKLFNMSDILFMPSLAELFPMSILEAVNVDKPVLLRDLYEYKEILFQEKDCYAVGNNVDEFDNQIKKFATDKKYYDHYVEGSRYISKYYNKENIKNIWREYYPRILEKWRKKKKIKPAK